MEKIVSSKAFWRNRNVLLTGHTGFKGAWLSLLLIELGANVYGFSLPAAPDSLYQKLNLNTRLIHHEGDIRNQSELIDVFERFKPDVVIHMAAQSLVLNSYIDPIHTWVTNVIGTANLLASVSSHKCAIVVVTTDKVYENIEAGVSYDENSRLGGYDPYSSSKAACEILVSSWHRSYFQNKDTYVVTARSGNVIGGGDWSLNRLFPDLARAFSSSLPLVIRNPDSTRPWQHVLDPLNGYLILAEQLFAERIEPGTAWNFGPNSKSSMRVRDVLQIASKLWPGQVQFDRDTNALYEAKKLSISTQKVRDTLGWSSRWDIEESIHRTTLWYQKYYAGFDAETLCLSDIDDFFKS